MDREVIDAILAGISPVIKRHYSEAISGIKALSDKFDPRLKAVEERFNALPLPEKGDKGDSVTLEDVSPMIAAEVDKAAQNIQVPEVDYETIKSFVTQEVASIPKPQDGKSITVDDVMPVIKELVDGIKIPVAEKGDKGDSVLLEDVRPVIDEAVVKAVQDIKLPEVDYNAVKDFVAEEVSKIPPAQDGKSVTIDDVAPMLKGLVDAIEIPVPEKGDPGENGASVSIEDVKPIIAEAVKSAVAEIPVPKDGDPGEPGKDAAPIDMNEVQKMIDAAVENAVSKIHIPEPKQAEDGKDALDIEILPEIDINKSFVRGTYAKHNGGLWRSFERTKGMRGWENIVEGIADIQIEYDGERGLKILTQKSNGEVVAKDFVMPVVIDRGVYKEGNVYTKNDGVTFAGSYWIAQKDTPVGKPGDGNSDFRLSVKKGRDANPTVKVK